MKHASLVMSVAPVNVKISSRKAFWTSPEGQAVNPIYIYIYIYTYECRYVYIHIHIYMCVSVCECIQMSIHVYIQVTVAGRLDGAHVKHAAVQIEDQAVCIYRYRYG